MEYKLKRNPRARRIILRVDKNGNVCVSAPKCVSVENIECFINSKKAWIEKRAQDLLDSKICAKNGARVRYFDEIFDIKITQSNKNEIRENGSVLEIRAKNMDDTRAHEKMLLSWLSMRASEFVNEIIARQRNIIAREVLVVKFRDMTTRWGSCNTKSAKITLSARLFAKPKICLEYVLNHELAHLRHANHGKEFYSTLEALMPSYKTARALLKS